MRHSNGYLSINCGAHERELFSGLLGRGAKFHKDNSMKWFADNSELNGIKEAEIPDILLFGGIAVPAAVEKTLRDQIEEVKSKHAHPRAPIKWNMKDLRSLYQKHKREDVYKKLIASSREWRGEIFSILEASEITLILACIESYSASREQIKSNKEQLTRFSFNNGLMRFGLHVQETCPDNAMVILDWPDKGNARPFDTEYSSAFNLGKTKCGSIEYTCGSLNQLNFSDSPVYSNMNHSTLLQAADLVVGATREVIECCLGKKEDGQGVDCVRIVKDKFRGAPNNVVGRGISVSTGNKKFRQDVSNGLKRLVYSS